MDGCVSYALTRESGDGCQRLSSPLQGNGVLSDRVWLYGATLCRQRRLRGKPRIGNGARLEVTGRGGTGEIIIEVCGDYGLTRESLSPLNSICW